MMTIRYVLKTLLKLNSIISKLRSKQNRNCYIFKKIDIYFIFLWKGVYMEQIKLKIVCSLIIMQINLIFEIKIFN